MYCVLLKVSLAMRLFGPASFFAFFSPGLPTPFVPPPDGMADEAAAVEEVGEFASEQSALPDSALKN
jgi:hypothetical protein